MHGKGGTFKQGVLPEARVAGFKLHYARPALRIDEGTLALGEKGVVFVSGGFRFAEKSSMDIALRAERCPLPAFLNQQWNSKLTGTLAGSVRLQRDAEEPLRSNGELKITDGLLKNVPALDKAAMLTGKERFRRMSIERVSATYEWNAPRLRVEKFVFESRGLLCVEGEFSVKNGAIDGAFQLGVAPEVADAVPGAREKVFTTRRDGYVWTDVKLTGPLRAPRDDLKKRLVAAATEHFAKGILAPLLKPGKATIESIEELY